MLGGLGFGGGFFAGNYVRVGIDRVFPMGVSAASRHNVSRKTNSFMLACRCKTGKLIASYQTENLSGSLPQAGLSTLVIWDKFTHKFTLLAVPSGPTFGHLVFVGRQEVAIRRRPVRPASRPPVVGEKGLHDPAVWQTRGYTVGDAPRRALIGRRETVAPANQRGLEATSFPCLISLWPVRISAPAAEAAR